MASVPALALAGSWPVAAVLIVLERVGRAIRNPPRDTMLSYAGKRVGGYVAPCQRADSGFGRSRGAISRLDDTRHALLSQRY
jgi:hypothetical protein